MHTPQVCLCLRIFFKVLDWIRNHWYIPDLHGCFRLCHWLSLRCSVPWINHLLHFLSKMFQISWSVKWIWCEKLFFIICAYIYIKVIFIGMYYYPIMLFCVSFSRRIYLKLIYILCTSISRRCGKLFLIKIGSSSLDPEGDMDVFVWFKAWSIFYLCMRYCNLIYHVITRSNYNWTYLSKLISFAALSVSSYQIRRKATQNIVLLNANDYWLIEWSQKWHSKCITTINTVAFEIRSWTLS